MVKAVLAGLVLIWISGCTVYKPDVQQGNAVPVERVNQLQKGMSKAEVKALLGTPLLQDDFHQNRWDYVFYEFKSGKQTAKKDLVLQFQGNRLASIRK